MPHTCHLIHVHVQNMSSSGDWNPLCNYRDHDCLTVGFLLALRMTGESSWSIYMLLLLLFLRLDQIKLFHPVLCLEPYWHSVLVALISFVLFHPQANASSSMFAYWKTGCGLTMRLLISHICTYMYETRLHLLQFSVQSSSVAECSELHVRCSYRCV